MSDMNNWADKMEHDLAHANERARDAEHKAHALQTELDALKAAHAWIKTSDRTPDVADGDCRDVLAVINGEVMVLNYTKDDSVFPWVDEHSSLYHDSDVTHWQPLPEPPK